MTRAVVMAGWDDVPHISPEEKARLLAGTEPHLRDARSRGIPALGAGAIYPISSDDYLVDDFVIPRAWPRAYGMDVGWKATAAVWGAWNRDTDVVYAWREYLRGHSEPAVHVSAIQAAGKQCWGAIDPASRGRSQVDGRQLLESYVELGLNLVPAKNAVEDGLFTVWERLTTGRLKLFRSLTQTLTEMRLYRRDDNGKVVKENDHLMDALRYLCMCLGEIMVWTPEPAGDSEQRRGRGGGSWMSA